MNDLVVADKGAEWRRLKALVLDSVSSPITRRVYNLGLDEFIAWYGQEARAGFTKATSPPGALRWRPASSAPSPSTCGLRRCASLRWRPLTTDYWRRTWPPASRA